jgi:hypothetical protein
MARPRLHESAAARQAAYRKRHRETARYETSEVTQPELFDSREHHDAGHVPKRMPTPAPRLSLAAKLYDIYPKKVGRGAAIKAIEQALKRLPRELQEMGHRSWLDDPIGELQLLLWHYSRSPAAHRGAYTPHCATWFNQSRYLDDILEWYRESDGEDVAALYRKLAMLDEIDEDDARFSNRTRELMLEAQAECEAEEEMEG